MLGDIQAEWGSEYHDLAVDVTVPLQGTTSCPLGVPINSNDSMIVRFFDLTISSFLYSSSHQISASNAVISDFIVLFIYLFCI